MQRKMQGSGEGKRKLHTALTNENNASMMQMSALV